MSLQLENLDIRPQLKVLIGNKAPFAWAAEVGIPKGSFHKIWNTGSPPQMSHLLLIAQKEGVSLDWLTTGEGPKKRGEGQVNDASEEHPLAVSPGEWDPQLMAELIEAVEEALEKLKVKIIPKEKGKLMVRLYKIHKDENIKVDKGEIRRHLRLVA